MAPGNTSPVSFQEDLAFFLLKRLLKVFGYCKRCQNVCSCQRRFENLSSFLLGPPSQLSLETVVNTVQGDKTLVSAVFLPACVLFLNSRRVHHCCFSQGCCSVETQLQHLLFGTFFSLTAKPNKSRGKNNPCIKAVLKEMKPGGNRFS